MRSGGTEKWQFANPVKAQAEAELQAMLVQSPYLIAIDEIRDGAPPLVLAVSEFGLPGSGRTDVLAFSADGDIAIVECKLAANPESKRKVIGQILEYAAYLWGSTYEEVDNRIQRVRNENLAGLVETAVAGEWEEEGFRSGVQRALEAGAFSLIVVVDEINEELRRTIRYINDCSQSVFSLHAMEMQRFQLEGFEILVPHVFGASAQAPGKESQQKRWTEERFFNVLSGSVEPGTVAIVRDLYDWSQETADRIWFGHGAERGSITFHYLPQGRTVSVFTVYTDGSLMLNLGWLSKQVDQETLERFHGRVSEIPPFSQIPADFSKWPRVWVAEALGESAQLDEFKQAVLWLWDAIQ